MEELLRDTPEPGTPPVCSPTPESPLTPGAATINPEAVDEPSEDMEAIVEGLLPWLKDISSSGSSNLRTPSPDIDKIDKMDR